jgi:sucrose-phosphate synthase
VGLRPDVIHSHYADAGFVGTRLANLLGVPLVHTGHSLGRVKRERLLAKGLKGEDIESRYNMSRRIEAEEETLANAYMVVASTQQEVEEQYALYDHYRPERMVVVPPGTDLARFSPPNPGKGVPPCGTNWPGFSENRSDPWCSRSPGLTSARTSRPSSRRSAGTKGFANTPTW